jgi:hypothetical protein
MKGFIARLVLGLMLWRALTPGAAAQSAIQVQESTARIAFPDTITFRLVAESDATIEEVTLHYGTDGRTCQSSTARQALEVDPGLDVDVSWTWELKRSGTLPPGTLVWWQWEIRTASGAPTRTDRQSQTVEDDEYTWQSVNESSITLNWAEGDAAFGAAMLRLAADSLDELAQNAGIRPPDDIEIWLYPSAAEVQEAILHAPEWTGGVAFPAFNSVVLGVGPDEDAWAAESIPHELAHLIVGMVAFNCRGIQLPTWLNEGLAVVAEGPADEAELDELQGALEAGRLPPLRTLANQFPADAYRAALAYIHSGQIVAFMIDEHGPDKMAALLAAMQGGLRIDPALRQVYGFDTDALDADWRQSLGFAVEASGTPVSGAARTPTAVPTFALWTPVARAATATALPSPTPSPLPPTATSASAPTSIASAPTGADPPQSPAAPLPPWLWGGLAGVLVLAAVVWTIRHRRR